MTILEVRALLDTVLEHIPSTRVHLSNEGDLRFHESFTSSIRKIPRNHTSVLSEEEAKTGKCLRIEKPELRVSGNDMQMSLHEKSIHKHFEIQNNDGKDISLELIVLSLTTACDFFSRAGFLLKDYRKAILPSNFEFRFSYMLKCTCGTSPMSVLW